MNKKILNLAIPSIISNITIPLLGLIDVAIVGHLGAVEYIGAIAIGGLIFNILYWNFGFLRMGTSGMTSQAFGRKNNKEIMSILLQSLAVALFFSSLMIILQYPIHKIAFWLIDADNDVKKYALEYFRVCIWGAPGVLMMYCFKGWFIGMQNSKLPMIISIFVNIVNIIASLIFVFVLHMKVAGVALGTIVAEYSGLLLTLILFQYKYSNLNKYMSLKESIHIKSMKRFFSINKDIFLRTLCLITVTTIFTSTGARQGKLILAVNTLIMQLFTIFSYIMDGFAYAGEALIGRYVGAGDELKVRQAIRGLFTWGLSLALFFTLLYSLWGTELFKLLTNDKEVHIVANQYFYWALIIPIMSFAAFMWDGILIGATQTKIMLLSIFYSMLAFLLIYYLGDALDNNNSLWLAFVVYLFFRGAAQTLMSRKVFFTKKSKI